LSYNDGNFEGFLKKNIVDSVIYESFSIKEKISTFIAIGLGLIHFNTDITIIDGVSMEPTFKNHKIIVKTNAAKDVKRMLLNQNTIVKFKSPEGDTSIKRIVALPGDTIEFDAMYIKVNGKTIDNTNIEPHPSSGIKTKAYSLSGNGKIRKTNPFVTTVTLKNNEYFVMGDNRSKSVDSRKYGPITECSIISIIEK
jgi:signal peptidase I